MKIYQKLILGFLGSSILIGGLGTYFLHINSNIKTTTKKLIGNTNTEAKASVNIGKYLYLIQFDIQEVLLANKEELGKIAKENRLKIKDKIDIIEGIIAADKTANQSRVDDRREEQLEDKEIIDKLEGKFSDYREDLSYFFTLIDSDKIDEARNYWSNHLNKKSRESIIPLVHKYQERSFKDIEEIEEEFSAETEKSLEAVKLYFVLSLLISMALLAYVYKYVYLPIKQLQNVALQVGLEEVGQDNKSLKNKDEISYLAHSYNYLVDSLKQKTGIIFYLESIMDLISESVIVIDSEKNIKKVNKYTSNILGYSQKELIGKKIDFILKEEKLNNSPTKTNESKVYLTKDKRKIPVAFSSNPISSKYGGMKKILCLAKDLSERYQTQKILRETQQRYALVARSLNDGLWEWDLKSKQVFYSPRWKSMLGYVDSEIGTTLSEWFKLVHSDNIQMLKEKFASHVKGKIPQLEICYRIKHKDGKYRWMSCRSIAVRDERSKLSRLVGSHTDINDRKEIEAQLRYETLHDRLTGLANRTLFSQQLQSLLQNLINLAQKSSNYLFAVMFLDLDRFKLINESLGHAVGDQLLIQIAKRLSTYIPYQNIIARLGGDKFGIVIENIKDIKEAKAIADSIQKQLAAPFELADREVYISASIGIALSTKHYDRAQDILRDAEMAMYRAKDLGKGCYAVFQPSMHLKALNFFELERDLRVGMSQSQFQVFYQPIINLNNKKIVGFEALIRWQHPKRGLVSPAEFMQVAHETGLIVSMSWWVTRQACLQMFQWQEQYPLDSSLFVSVNVSPLQFCQPDFADRIAEILRETGLKPYRLKLEITESAIRENIDRATSILQKLKSLGVNLTLDNFGKDYSSLSYLHSLPIDTLEIDSSLIQDIDNYREKYQVIRSIVNLTSNLGMEPIAEGVETMRQADKLKELSCQYAKGYFFFGVLTNEVAEALIANQQSSSQIAIQLSDEGIADL